MADIVGEAQRLGEILVEAERARHRPADLGDLEAVGEPDPEMIAVGRDEDLGLVAQAAERDRMDDPVAIALEGVARAPAGRPPARREAARAKPRGIGRRSEPPASPGGKPLDLLTGRAGPGEAAQILRLELVDEGLGLLRSWRTDRPADGWWH